MTSENEKWWFGLSRGMVTIECDTQTFRLTSEQARGIGLDMIDCFPEFGAALCRWADLNDQTTKPNHIQPDTTSDTLTKSNENG